MKEFNVGDLIYRKDAGKAAKITAKKIQKELTRDSDIEEVVSYGLNYDTNWFTYTDDWVKLKVDK